MNSSGSSMVARPRQRLSLIPCPIAATNARMPVRGLSGAMLAAIPTISVVAIVTRSTGSMMRGNCASPRARNQFAVKFGTMRPAMTVIRTSTRWINR